MDPKPILFEWGQQNKDNEIILQINISPPRERFPPAEELDNQVYYAKDFPELKYVIIDAVFIPFCKMPYPYTLLAYGQFSLQWRRAFMQAHPEVHDNTEMVLFFYKKIVSL